MPAWFYILKCSDGSYYCGSTIDIDARVWEHQNGEGGLHTARYRPVKLIYWEEFFSVADAFDRENQVKKWTRKKKEALIEGDGETLEKLALAKWKLKDKKT